jgi:hypothetical protein
VDLPVRCERLCGHGADYSVLTAFFLFLNGMVKHQGDSLGGALVLRVNRYTLLGSCLDDSAPPDDDFTGRVFLIGLVRGTPHHGTGEIQKLGSVPSTTTSRAGRS